jgi:undecaprenyl-diphosphatase
MAEATTENPIKKLAAEPEHNAAVAPSWVRRYRARLFQGYVILAVIAFGLLAFSAHYVNYFPLDVQLTLAIQRINIGAFDVLMRFLTELGFGPQVNLFWALTALLLYVMGLKWESLVTVISVVGAGVLDTAVKLLVGRPRPDASVVHVFSALLDSSFPSGHVMFYVSLVGFLWFLCFTLVKRGRHRTLGLWVFGVTVVLAGPSRIYLGQHWASDVLGAYLLGSVWLALIIAIYRWGKTRFFVTQPVAPETPHDKSQPATT